MRPFEKRKILLKEVKEPTTVKTIVCTNDFTKDIDSKPITFEIAKELWKFPEYLHKFEES